MFRAFKSAVLLLGMVTLTLFAAMPERATAEDDPPKPTVIAGVVVDTEGNPVPGAVLKSRHFAFSKEPIVTDEAGRFEQVDRLPREQSFTITATSPDGEQMGRLRVGRLGIVIGRKLDWREFLANLEITVTPPFPAKIRVQDEHGNPVPDAVVGMRVDRQDLPTQRTDEQGETTIEVPGAQPIDVVHAWKDGKGLDYRSFFTSSRGRANPDLDRKPFPEEGLTLTLEGAQPIELIVRDQTGQPVAEAEVQMPDLMKQSENTRLERFAYLTREQRQTDKQGRLKLDWFPHWHRQPIQFVASKSELSPGLTTYLPGDEGPVEIVMEVNVPIEGRVLDHEGKPIVGVRVVAGGGGYLKTRSTSFGMTDAEGKYQLRAAAGLAYLITVTHPGVTTEAQGPLPLELGKPLRGIDFTRLEKPTRVYGMLTNRVGKPLPGVQIVCTQYFPDQKKLAELGLPNPDQAVEANLPAIAQAMNTNAQGHFQFHLGPGHYTLRPYHGARGKVEEAVELELTDEVKKELILRIDEKM